MLKLITLASFILALALPVSTQAQANVQLDQIAQLDPIVGAPTVAITKLDLFKPNSLTRVGVEWSVQKPTLTQIISFQVSFEVTYQNGQSQELIPKSITDVSARAATFDNLPGLAVQSTQTVLRTLFTTPGNLTDTEDFTLGSAAPPAPPQKPLDLTQVTQVTQGCGANQACFEVKWSANTGNSPSLKSFNGFNVKLDVNFANGATASANANASGGERQKIIAVTRPHGSSPQTVKATINAAVTLAGNVAVAKQTP
jgi:hypothetical protein